MIDIPSPAVSVVGRRNSGKTTLVVKLIFELVSRGYDVGSVKHHHCEDFEIDIPGKDSFRHFRAGASETIISSPHKIAVVKDIQHEMECAEIVRKMPGHDIVIVEGYRKSGLPTIEVMRAENSADAKIAALFVQGAQMGISLETDFTQWSRDDAFKNDPILEPKKTTENTIAVVTDIPEAVKAAKLYGVPSFALDDVSLLADFLEKGFLRSKLTIAIQAGGESRRMGQSKALVPFMGRPLICRIIERLSSIADELIITTNEREKLLFLTNLYPNLAIRFVPDLYDFRGALPGIQTALQAATFSCVAIVACDMLFVSPRLIIAESIAMRESGADAVVPVNNHGYEPFHAIYCRETCLSVIREILQSGEMRVQSLLNRINIVKLSHHEVLDIEPRGSCFVNVNTPEELHAFEKTLLEEKRS